MKITKFLYSPDLSDKIKKISSKDKSKIIKKINIFLSDPHSGSLKTHKLSGKLKDYWAFSVSYRLRVLFRFVNSDSVEFIDIGGHEIYK